MRQRPHLRPHHQPLGLALALALCVAACGGGAGGSSTQSATPLTIVVNAPFTGAPEVAEGMANGVDLAVQQRTQGGVLTAGDHRYRVRISKLDDQLSPLQALRNVRTAIDDHALAVVDEGTGVDASWSAANAARVPIGIVYQGGQELVDRSSARTCSGSRRPTAGSRSASASTSRRSTTGSRSSSTTRPTGATAGRRSTRRGHSTRSRSWRTSSCRPANRPLAAGPPRAARRRERADRLARGPAIASVVSAARSRGWSVPVYTTPAGADPIVRQQLADHSQWVDGLTFASGRMTAEAGPGPFEQFQQAYESAFGPNLVGVKTKEGAPVTQPPEFAMYAYDMTQAILAALQTPAAPATARSTSACSGRRRSRARTATTVPSTAGTTRA